MVVITHLILLLAASFSQAAVIIRDGTTLGPRDVFTRDDGPTVDKTKSTLLADLKKINVDLGKATAKVKEFHTNNVRSIFPLEVARDKLESTIQRTTGLAASYHQLSSADATAGIDFLTGVSRIHHLTLLGHDSSSRLTRIDQTLEPGFAAHIGALVDKIEYFAAAKYTKSVARPLEALKQDVDNLFGALKTKFPADQQEAYQGVTEKIDDDLQEGITTFFDYPGP
ncbi:hydrophobic surface binding protein [Teratosphaeria destructans]|uniref:Hydrophobic surface binding protein n=1 Tax=Teratosphaeria destructans TaxID=418781 RepID=A0A9W7SY99_9PEZI|nr:hydrophobic surface binding protein [Teratosphaeria destructans]